ncbi:di-trans,poly-cis-decaprenylcistransferase [Candidatus Uhrbacteria bacterium]|nr:di-trans,poly-cis-decaprenylcistransferase [Candidatus Uhrbacteria bacterium]
MSDASNIQHLAIIMDGNRRWAKERGLLGYMGHEKGYETLKNISSHVFSRGIKIFTVFAFSTENWNRTEKEVKVLFTLFDRAVQEQFGELSKNNIQLRFIGDISVFPKTLCDEMDRVMRETEKNTKGILNVALNYGGRQEIVHVVQNIIADGIEKKDITEGCISRYAYTKGLPDPELLIRTSGEQRLSGFLTWQTVYSELYFLEKLWPDITPEDIDTALIAYVQRQRRFGA